MKRVSGAGILVFVLLFLFSSISVFAQNTYELRQYTDEDWNSLSTEERLDALNTANNQAVNQTFVGSFGRNYDLAPTWGYDYYEMDDRYMNYAFRGFENYNILNNRRSRDYYNQFGDKMGRMRNDATIWSETYNDDGSSEFRRTDRYINRFSEADGIWVARESTDDWAVSVVGAEALRAKLTPLTFSLPNISGVKVDFQSANYSASYITSHILGTSHPFRRGFEVVGRANEYYIGDSGGNQKSSSALILKGGQVRRKFGALTIGATYVNMHNVQDTRKGGSTLKGHVSDHAPTPIRYLLRVVDDSPQDGDGPIVHDVRLIVNGVHRSDIVPTILLDDITRELDTAIHNKNFQRYAQYGQDTVGQSVDWDITSLYKRSPKYVDYMYMDDYIHGWNSDDINKNYDITKANEYYSIIDPGGRPVQVNGNEYVVYMFDLSSISDKLTSVEAEVTVSNDYRVDSATVFSDKKNGRNDSAGDNYTSLYKATYWYTQGQADGNVKDGSNLTTIKVDFGYEVANIIYGLDAHFNYLGFKFNAEYVVNQRNFMFADGNMGDGVDPVTNSTERDLTPSSGKRSSRSDDAYYLTIQKDWGNFGFAGEYFKMGKFYSPEFMYFSFKSVAGTIGRSRNNFFRMTMIEDNDDNDQYPDDMPFNMGLGISEFSLYDPDGVFPGNDLDHDGIPDNDKNYNAIPDYNEPFLMLDSDPDEFVFGDDINNNGSPDFRENDVKYDTPYELDRRGHHFNINYSPQENINVILGSMRQRGIALDTRSDDDYMKLKVNYLISSIGSLIGEYRYHRIKDNIADLYFLPVATPVDNIVKNDGKRARYTAETVFDEVEYRNSSVNRMFLQSNIRAIPSITLQSHVKYERNYRIEGTAYDNIYQAEDVINTLAVSSKFVYTKQWGNFTVSPGLKYRMYKKGYRESLNPRKHYFYQIPIVMLKYRVSPSTNISLGFQGFKGFETLYKDLILSQNNYKQKNILFQIENTSTYFGFQIWGGMGFQLEEIRFDEEYRSFENYKTSSLFVRLYLESN